ncbi:MAG: Trm112 family protein [Oscillospiraceae bacterium]
MANQVTNYKCPACTGPLRFDSATGKLQCDFCGSRLRGRGGRKALRREGRAGCRRVPSGGGAGRGGRRMGLRLRQRLGCGRGKAARLFLPELRRGAYLRRDDQRDLLPLLRQQHHRARAVQRCAQARLCAALQVG